MYARIKRSLSGRRRERQRKRENEKERGREREKKIKKEREINKRYKNGRENEKARKREWGGGSKKERSEGEREEGEGEIGRVFSLFLLPTPLFQSTVEKPRARLSLSLGEREVANRTDVIRYGWLCWPRRGAQTNCVVQQMYCKDKKFFCNGRKVKDLRTCTVNENQNVSLHKTIKFYEVVRFIWLFVHRSCCLLKLVSIENYISFYEKWFKLFQLHRF